MEFQILGASISGALITFIALKYIRVPMTYEIFVSVVFASMLMFISSYGTIMNIDRSKSSYLLSWIHDNPEISRMELRAKLEAKSLIYDEEYLEKRILEHIERGVFTEKNGELSTSYFGNFLYGFADLAAGLFRLDGWQRAKI